MILSWPPGNHKPMSPVCSQPSSSMTSFLFNQLHSQVDSLVLNFVSVIIIIDPSSVRLDFVFIVALKDNWTPDTDFSTRMGLILRGVIHFRDIHQFYF